MEPVIHQTAAFAIDRCCHAATAVVTDHHDVLHLDHIDGELEHRQVVGILRRCQVGYVAMDKQFSWIEIDDFVRRDAAVGTADPQIFGGLLALQPFEESGVGGDFPSGPGAVVGFEVVEHGISKRDALARVKRFYAGGPVRQDEATSARLEDVGNTPGRTRAMAGNAQKIIELDRQRMTAMAEKDIATLNAIIADDLIYCHSSARLDTKQSLIGAMESGATVYTSVVPSDVVAQDFGDAVVLTGVAAISVNSGGNANSFRVRFIDVYANRSGQWQMVTWQSTKLA